MNYLLNPKYRPDIDGLRAFAVISVLIYHAFPQSMRGGFMGVDIFFVISGFLISSIIFDNLINEKFSFIDFYMRRIKRIFPALILVLLATYLIGWFALLADEYMQVSQHIVAGTGFLSNLLLLQEAGYFDNSAETKPLLHLWSLAVEEQFYLVWPLLIFISWKKNFNLLILILVIALLSFITNIQSVSNNPTAAFYLPQTRFWELMSGSLLAWIMTFKQSFIYSWPQKNLLISNAISLSGITILIFSVFCLNNQVSFPGYWALLPVIGTSLLILAGPIAWINKKLLAHPFIVAIGLISYPLYLWHWPLLTFSRILDTGHSGKNLSIILSIALAWLTFQLVEKPIRFGSNTRLKVFLMIILMLAIGFTGFITYIEKGLIYREAASLKDFKVGHIDNQHFFNTMEDKFFLCTPNKIAQDALKFANTVRCMQSKQDDPIDIALIGDSHAEHLFMGLAEGLPNKNIVYYIKDSLPYIENPEYKDIFEEILNNKNIKSILLESHWIDRLSHMPSSFDFDKELNKTLFLLNQSGKKVYVLTDVPHFPFSAVQCKGKRWITMKNAKCDISAEKIEQQSNSYLTRLESQASFFPKVRVLHLEKYLCDTERYSMVSGNEILYRDSHHLNILGSKFVGKQLIRDNQDIFE